MADALLLIWVGGGRIITAPSRPSRPVIGRRRSASAGASQQVRSREQGEHWREARAAPPVFVTQFRVVIGPATASARLASWFPRGPARAWTRRPTTPRLSLASLPPTLSRRSRRVERTPSAPPRRPEIIRRNQQGSDSDPEAGPRAPPPQEARAFAARRSAARGPAREAEAFRLSTGGEGPASRSASVAGLPASPPRRRVFLQGVFGIAGTPSASPARVSLPRAPTAPAAPHLHLCSAGALGPGRPEEQ